MADALVEKLLADRRAFLAFVRRRVESDEVAEDLLQAALSRAIERRESLRADESVVAWFYRLLRNAVVDHYRRRAAESRALAEEKGALPLELADEPQLKSELCRCMGQVIEELKPEYRDALRAVELGDETPTTYAQRLGITANSAGVRVHRARNALKKRLEVMCGACAAHGCLDCSCRTATSRGLEPAVRQPAL